MHAVISPPHCQEFNFTPLTSARDKRNINNVIRTENESKRELSAFVREKCSSTETTFNYNHDICTQHSSSFLMNLKKGQNKTGWNEKKDFALHGVTFRGRGARVFFVFPIQFHRGTLKRYKTALQGEDRRCKIMF